MKKYILFGAGQYALNAIDMLGKEKIYFIVDNNKLKSGTKIRGINVYYVYDVIKKLKEKPIVLSVSSLYEDEIIEQLKKLGISNYWTMNQVRAEQIKEKIEKRTDYIEIYHKAITWIQCHMVDGKAIICNTNKCKGYPEVTGYYIPTLIHWGYRDIAISFAKWLCEIQKEDGSWYDTDDKAPYIFDTAQILKGLLAIREIYPYVDENIKKGCDWILKNVQDCGHLITPTQEEWGNKRTCSELIHLYCLSPLVQASDIFHISRYKETAYKILHFYKKNHYDEIMNFGLLSHFYAYVMEGLLDMGEKEMVTEAMGKVALLQKENGAVPAYCDVDWVCSTGLFQFSLIWFRLNDMEHGKKAFEYACKLQNQSGGWYGSYLSEDNALEENTYFPTSEISWAVKYFLDALYYKNISEFDLQADSFLDKIEKTDERYEIVKENIKIEKKQLKILDVGCGKGRYLKNLLEDIPEQKYYAVDLSENVMRYIVSDQIIKKQGSLTNIPYNDCTFDIVYTCEALEHAIDIESAIKEMVRVTKSGGKIIVIDKNKDEIGRMEIDEGEQWLDEKKLRDIMKKNGVKVEVKRNIAYEKRKDGLFIAWIGTVEKV